MSAQALPAQASNGVPLLGGPAGAALARNVGCVAAAFAILAFPILAHLLHPLVAAAAAIGLAGAAFLLSPATAVAAVLFSALFQNFVVSLVSPSVSPGTDFVLIRGYNFLVLATVWALAMFAHFALWRGRSTEVDRLVRGTSAAIAAILVYFVVGLTDFPQTAAIYFRNVAAGLMTYQAALIIGFNRSVRVGTVLAIAAGILVVLGYVELLDRDDWLAWTNGSSYWDLAMADQKAAGTWDRQARMFGIVILGLRDSFKVDFLNTPLLSDLGLSIERMFGPNMHAISYAYALAFFFIYTLFTRRFVLALLLLPLLLFANAKGALVTVAATVLGWALFRLIGARLAFAVLTGVLVLYAGAGIVIGLGIGDFHVLGLMGGVHNFLDFPVGHGLGDGGNLGIDFTTLNWSEFQHAGRTPIAVESSVGVLLYKMGVAAFLVLGCYAWLSWTTLSVARRTGDPLHAAAGFALLAILFNGLFQEEALFSPLAIGLALALCGLIHGAFYRHNDP